MSAVLVEAGLDAGAIWHFGEPNKEQRELVAGNGWADLSHRAVVTVSGSDRTKWLNDMMTQELATLPVGQWSETLLLDAQGHIEQQLFLVDDGNATWLHLEASKTEELITYLNRMKFMLDVDVQDRSTEFAVLRAPGAVDNFGGPYALVPRGELPDLVAAYQAAGHMQVGTWALEAERIAAGRARILLETDHKSIPNELGFLNTAVHMNKGCYRGQETVAKVYNLGKPPRRLVLLHLDGSMVHMPEHGAKITLEGKEIGQIGSMARHYELGPIALAVIKRSVPASATLDIDGVSATQEVLVAAD
jgi:folate-binding protein YgfZ